jgi:transcriptional regulator with XRE-family HTH domain
MVKITAFGKSTRRFRLDSDVSLGDMADAVAISPALLSSIETGKKNIKESIVEKLAAYMGLVDEALLDFQLLAARCNSELKTNLKNHKPEAIETVTLLARHLGDLEENTLKSINEMIFQDTKNMNK